MKKVVSVAILAGVVACGPSRKEQIASFMQKCEKTDFTHAQCELLATMYGASLDAESSADTATGVAAVGVGLGSTRR